MKNHVLSFLIAAMLGACCSQPDLQANWYSVAVGQQAPQARNADPSSYAPLQTSSRLLLAILNRERWPVSISSVEVNPPADDTGPGSRDDESSRPWPDDLLLCRKPLRLESGESRMFDLSIDMSQPSGNAGDRRNCHLPVRLRLVVARAEPGHSAESSRRTVMLTLREPMPSAVPPGWEVHCIEAHQATERPGTAE